MDDVCKYLSQEANMSEYNDLVVAYRDLEDISHNAKITWSKCPQILFIKPRDFVTFCHYRYRKDGTQIVLNQACEHEKAPRNDVEEDGKVCRASALRGANCKLYFSKIEIVKMRDILLITFILPSMKSYREIQTIQIRQEWLFSHKQIQVVVFLHG